MSSSRLVDAAEWDRTTSKGTSFKTWERNVFRKVTSTTLPCLGFNASTAATQNSYKFSSANQLEQVINTGNAKVRAPQLIVYATGMTSSTAWGPMGSNLAMIQSVNFHDQASSTVINQSQNEIAWAANVDLYLRPHLHESEHAILNYTPPASGTYDGSDLQSASAGTDLVPFNVAPYGQASAQTLCANSQYNEAAVRSVLNMRQQFTFSASCGPQGQPGFVSKGPFDICMLRHLASGATTLDFLCKSFNWTFEIKLNGVAGQSSSVVPFWSTLSTALSIYLPSGLEIAYQAVNLDPAADSRLSSMYKAGWSKRCPYLQANVVTGLPGMVASTASAINLSLGPWVRPVCVIHSAIPTGAMLNPQRSSFMMTNATYSNYNLRSANIALFLEPTSNVEKAYESLLSWMDVDALGDAALQYLSVMPTYAQFQSFAGHMVSDLRPLLSSFGDSTQNLSVTATRTDAGLPAVDHIFVIYTLCELEYQCSPNGAVRVVPTA